MNLEFLLKAPAQSYYQSGEANKNRHVMQWQYIDVQRKKKKVILTNTHKKKKKQKNDEIKEFVYCGQ